MNRIVSSPCNGDAAPDLRNYITCSVAFRAVSITRPGETRGFMRQLFFYVFLLLVLALGVCAFFARRSRKAIGKSVSLLLLALIPPMIGNMILIQSEVQSLSYVGCYIYFLGMDLVMFALLRFTTDYCQISWASKALKVTVYALLIIDAVQLCLNPVFGHAFATEQIMVDGAEYYRLVPFMGQTFHRIVDYGIFFSVLIVFLMKTIRSPRIYSERYSVILLSMIVGGAWQSYYIFSRTPVDRSMIGFAIFGLLVFYFSLHYRPMRLLDRMLAGIASEMPEALFFFDATGQCIWANQPALTLTGGSPDNFEPLTGQLTAMFGDFRQLRDGWASRREFGSGEETRHFVLIHHSVKDDRGHSVGSFLTVRDNTEEQQALMQEKYNATHDQLTGLYNREHLYRMIEERLAAEPETPWLIAYLDINDFKIVNDIFGNDFGDFVLKSLADRLRAELKDTCVYGRLTGDTFGVLIQANALTPDMVEAELARFTCTDGTITHHVEIHIGTYTVDENAPSVSAMFDRARMALSTIKENYHIHIAGYDEQMRRQVLWNQHISSELHEALATGQIRPYLQAIVDHSGQVIGAEALVRWIHPRDGFLTPAAFIPIFENNGMIAEVDKYMWNAACEILARWKKEGRNWFISVNISPKDFFFMDVYEELTGLVAKHGVEPGRLRVEITETVMMTDIANRIEMLQRLKESGFIVEMDDFGSGYSSLNLLKDMPVDILKIDMAFLRQSGADQKARIILRDIIQLADKLGIQSLTEGVETQRQYQMLSDIGCKLFQGYYFAKPVSVEDFEVQNCA